MAALTQLDTENADRNIASEVAVLTHTPDASNARLCQAIILLGDGSKDLDGTGGDFEVRVTIDGNTVNGGAETKTLGTQDRAALQTESFTVPANAQIIVYVTSPNAGDTDVDVTATLYDVGPSSEPLDAAGIRSAVGMSSANLDTQLGDIPTVAEFNARTLLAASYFDATTDQVIVGTNNDKTGYALTSAAIAAIEAALINEGDGQQLIDAIVTAIEDADIENDVLPALIRDAILDRVLAGNHDTAGTVGKALQDAAALSPLDAAGVRAAVGLASANLDTQLADIPTVAEFEARTLVAASYFDPTTDQIIVGTNNDKTGYQLVVAPLTAAGIRSAVGMSSANLDSQLGDIPTVAEFNARTLVAADYFDAATDQVIVGTNNDKTGYALTSAAIAAIEAALINEGDGQQLIDAIVTAIEDADIENDVLPALIRDAILDRVLSGNHDTAGTVGKALQDAAAASSLDAAGVRAALGMSSANLDTQLADIPTVAEFEARTLVAASYFDPTTDQIIVGTNNDKTGYQLVVAPLTAAGIRSAVGMSSANLDTQVADIPTVAEFNARTLVAADYFDAATDQVIVSTNNDKTGYALTSADHDSIAAALLDLTDGVESGETLRQCLRLLRAALIGKASGLDGTTVTFRDKADAKDRITATVDSDGNRSAVTTDAT